MLSCAKAMKTRRKPRSKDSNGSGHFYWLMWGHVSGEGEGTTRFPLNDPRSENELLSPGLVCSGGVWAAPQPRRREQVGMAWEFRPRDAEKLESASASVSEPLQCLGQVSVSSLG